MQSHQPTSDKKKNKQRNDRMGPNWKPALVRESIIKEFNFGIFSTMLLESKVSTWTRQSSNKNSLFTLEETHSVVLLILKSRNKSLFIYHSL